MAQIRRGIVDQASSYEIECKASSDDRRVTLPSAAQHDELVEVSLWGDSDSRLEALWAQHAAQAHPSAWGRSVGLPLVLVHRSDNRYNPNAISVSTPARADVAVEQRHLGYLYDDYLEQVGEFALPDLIGFAGGQVWCTAYIEHADAADAEWLSVALPDPEVLGHAVRDFLRSHGVPNPGGPRRKGPPPQRPVHQTAHPATAWALDRLRAPAAAPAPVTGLRIATRRYQGLAHRDLHMVDEGTGRSLGVLDDSWLRLDDERDRNTVLSLLGNAGIAADQPVSTPKLAEGDAWPLDALANIGGRRVAGGFELHVRSASGQTVAETATDSAFRTAAGRGGGHVPISAQTREPVAAHHQNAEAHVLTDYDGSDLVTDPRSHLQASHNHAQELHQNPEQFVSHHDNGDELDDEHDDMAGRVDPTPMFFAFYNVALDVLWVQDSRLVDAALQYVHRQGIDVDEVWVPRQPWALTDEVSSKFLRDPDRPWGQWLENVRPPLSRSLRKHLPAGLLSGQEVWWTTAEQVAFTPGPALCLLEEYVSERGAFFPVHKLTGELTQCRLCTSAAATFTTPVATEPLAYCHSCLESAATGLVSDRVRAAKALARLSELEFDGRPMLVSQLTSLHVNPAEPVQPDTIDRMLLLRFGIDRARVPWTLLLEAAGLATEGVRTGRGTLIRARDGHLCWSLGERAVCDFLHRHGIEHEREPLYPPDPQYNQRGRRRADWVLSDGTLVELWGLPDDPVYAAKMLEKRRLALRHGLSLVELNESDLSNLASVFTRWMSDVPSAWAWSPQLDPPPSDPPRQAQSLAERRGRTRDLGAEPPVVEGEESSGRTELTAEQQGERVARCVRALQLQQAGLTRTQIAQSLGVATDTVKALIRDGRFYADPSSGRGRRLALARSAALARAQGRTRKQFQHDAGLSFDGARQAWRDAAAVLGPTATREDEKG